MSKTKIIRAVSLAPEWINKLIIKLNFAPNFIFGKKYKKIFCNFNNFSEQDFLIFFRETAKNNMFYNKLYGNTIDQISTLNDYKKIVNFIDKEVVLSKFSELTSADKEGFDTCTTGGTSGKPLKILQPKSRYTNELGALHALWSKIGYNFSTRAVVRNEKINGRDFLINPITKEFIFDGFRTDEVYLLKIYEVMKKYRIPFFHGYTSNAEKFFSFILEKKLDYSFIKGVITSSENLYEHQKHLFQKLNGTHHMNFFGHSEKLILGGWCELGSCYHFYNSYGYVELVDINGEEVKETGQIGELVGSTNYNRYMPLFRYKTGDYAEKAPAICSGCGFSGLSAYKILGRWKGERIFNKDGSYVTTTALNLHSDIYDSIDALQYYQPTHGHLEIRVIPSKSYNETVEESLLLSIKDKLAPDAVISVKKVIDVEKKENGKYLLLISDLS